MRIISGKYRSRHIILPKNLKARPTTDFAKENLFNILSNHFDFQNIDVLDLFSGTGSISYEFSSRGCKNVISVENNFRHFSYIKKNIEKLNLEGIKVIKTDAFKLINKIDMKFDIIFADPPYDHENIYQLPKLIFKNQILKTKGWFILEHGKNYNFSGQDNFKELREYGSVHFSIFLSENNF